MKVYIRKIMKHDITHEVSLTAYAYYEFFDGGDSVSFQINGEGSIYDVTFNNATDLRFGGDFKTMCRLLEVRLGDFLHITHNGNGMYSIRVERANEASASKYYPFFTGTRRHLIATIANGVVSTQYIR